jgi:outer membrane protein W
MKVTNGANGSATGTVEAHNNPPTVQPQVHLQLPDTASRRPYYGVGSRKYVLTDDPRAYQSVQSHRAS